MFSDKSCGGYPATNKKMAFKDYEPYKLCVKSAVVITVNQFPEVLASLRSKDVIENQSAVIKKMWKIDLHILPVRLIYD